MDDKKKFVKPEADILEFTNEDIITFSNGGEYPDEWIGDSWGDK